MFYWCCWTSVLSTDGTTFLTKYICSSRPSSAYNLSASARPNRAGDSSPACVTPRLSPRFLPHILLGTTFICSALSFSDAVKQRKETSPVPKDRTVRFSLPLNDEKLTAEVWDNTLYYFKFDPDGVVNPPGLATANPAHISLFPYADLSVIFFGIRQCWTLFRVSTGHLDCNGDALPSSGSGTSDDSRIPMPAHHKFPLGPLIPWSLLFGSDKALKEAEEKMFNDYKKLIPGHENLFPVSLPPPNNRNELRYRTSRGAESRALTTLCLAFEAL